MTLLGLADEAVVNRISVGEGKACAWSGVDRDWAWGGDLVGCRGWKMHFIKKGENKSAATRIIYIIPTIYL